MLKTLSTAMALNSTGFLPNLTYKYNRAMSATTAAYIRYSDTKKKKKKRDAEVGRHRWKPT